MARRICVLLILAITSLRLYGCSESATLFMGILSQDIGSMDASSAMVDHSKAFVVARNKHVVSKQRRIERLTAGYAVQEFRDDSQGRYWYVVTALEVIADQ